MIRRFGIISERLLGKDIIWINSNARAAGVIRCRKQAHMIYVRYVTGRMIRYRRTIRYLKEAPTICALSSAGRTTGYTGPAKKDFVIA